VNNPYHRPTWGTTIPAFDPGVGGVHTRGATARNPNFVLGKLTLTELSFGMAVFTAIMVYDIYSFGRRMREQLQELLHKKDVPMFGREGKAVW